MFTHTFLKKINYSYHINLLLLQTTILINLSSESGNRMFSAMKSLHARLFFNTLATQKYINACSALQRQAIVKQELSLYIRPP